MTGGGGSDRTPAPDEPRALDVPLYNSSITNTYVKLIRKRYPQVDLGELLRYAGMELHQVQDEGHWFTQREVNRFQEKLRDLTGNKNIAREAGVYSASPEAIGGIGRYILGLVSPAQAYALAGKFTTKFTRSSRVESRPLGPNSAEILITPNPGVHEEPFQCENRQGYLESIARHFNARLLRIEHPECLFHGGARCRYVVTWERSRASLWRRMAAGACGLTLAGCAAAVAGLLSWSTLAAVLPAAIVAVLLINTAAMRLENRELQTAVTRLEHSSDELVDQIDLNYRNALMINEVGQTLGKERSIEDIVKGVVEILARRLDYDRGIVLLANPERSRLAAVAGFGYRLDTLKDMEGESGFRLDQPDSRGVFVRCYREQRAFIVNDIAAAAAEFSPRSLEIASRIGVKSFICCPIVYENESLGILAVDNLTRKRPLLQRDANLLTGITPQIALCIRNVRLVEDGLEQVRRLNAELEQRVAARTLALEEANRELESFSYSVSHDLRAPLRAIEGFSQVLVEEFGTPFGGEAQRLLGVVSANARRMAQLIDDLLAFSRLGRADLRAGRVDMAALAAQVFEELCPPERRAQVELRLGALPACRGDAALLRQVWANLLGNALKFSSKREQARIAIGGDHRAGEIDYHVDDNGVGFDMEYADKLFGVFQRLHSPAQFDGTGVGLAIVQRIVRRHGGRVWARGRTDEGASFGFTLPAGGADDGSGRS
jgi:signal transduction histidine kinase